MAIQDFIRKEWHLAREKGLRTATTAGLGEISGWAKHRSGIYNYRETPIWNYDWDICLVLDAMRYDAYCAVAPEYDWLPNRPNSIWSVGSASPEWIGKTFHPDDWRRYESVGYVTANPFSAKPSARAAGAPSGSLPLTSPPLEFLDEVWRDGWEQDPLSTVPPSTMTDRALYAWANMPVEQLIVHYLQPHIPFRSRAEWFGRRENLKYFGEPDKEAGSERDIWLEVRDGAVPADEVWDAYLDNLRWVLDDVNRIRRSTRARIAITADHGNGLGEGGVWSHPPERQAPVLRNVPFAIVEGTGEVGAGGVKPSRGTRDIAREEKLHALGYVER